jgi:pyruvate dehydrogenase E2 component (dihydrolipoamide acetyltransferase)
MSHFRPLERPSSFRRVAAASWVAPNDPTIYGTMSVEMSGVQRYLAELRETSGVKVTVTHLVARAVAIALGRHPDLNGKVRFGRILLRDSVDLFLQVSADGGADLSGAKIERADKKGLLDIARELADKAASIREGRDPALKKSRSIVSRLPWFLVRPFLRFADFLVNTLQLDLRGSGMPRDPFGSAMVTSVGMFGIDIGYAPFMPLARCPVLILVGEVQEKPWAVEGRVEARPVMNLNATFDHRIIDGYHAGVLAREIRALLSDPKSLE